MPTEVQINQFEAETYEIHCRLVAFMQQENIPANKALYALIGTAASVARDLDMPREYWLRTAAKLFDDLGDEPNDSDGVKGTESDHAGR